MEPRLSALEAAVGEIKTDLKAIRTDLTRLLLDLAEMKGKLSNVPTTFQLVFMQAGLILAIFAGAFGLLKLASPH
jgi:ABC-type phosphate transport system auxiliary subunit